MCCSSLLRQVEATPSQAWDTASTPSFDHGPALHQPLGPNGLSLALVWARQFYSTPREDWGHGPTVTIPHLQRCRNPIQSWGGGLPAAKTRRSLIGLRIATKRKGGGGTSPKKATTRHDTSSHHNHHQHQRPCQAMRRHFFVLFFCQPPHSAEPCPTAPTPTRLPRCASNPPQVTPGPGL